MEKYICPVCGYPDLKWPPYDSYGHPSFNICPCCGCEYGYEDATEAGKLRFLRNWLEQGAPWFKPALKPPHWDVNEQLKNVGITVEGEKLIVDPKVIPAQQRVQPTPPVPSAPAVDRSRFKETINRKEYEWIEIPAGKFVTGISAEQVKAFQERIRKEQHYDRLSPKEQALLESAIAKAWAWKEKREMLSKEEKAVVRSDYDPSVPAGPGWPIYEVEAILATIPPSQEHSLDTFYITRYPVTFHQFYPFQFQEPHKDPESYSPQEVVWRKDVEAFCTWAGARLPSPLEWEKAGRGAEGFLYPWGNEWDPRRGNFIGESGIRGYPPKELKALGAYVTKVNAYPKGASPYGVMDMAGNLREFTSQKGVAKAYNARRGKKEILWAQHLLSRDTFDESHDIKDGGLCFRLALDHLDPQLWPGFRASKKKKQATKFRIRLWKGAV